MGAEHKPQQNKPLEHEQHSAGENQFQQELEPFESGLGQGKVFHAPIPNHSTSRGLRHANALAVQRSVGNRGAQSYFTARYSGYGDKTLQRKSNGNRIATGDSDQLHNYESMQNVKQVEDPLWGTTALGAMAVSNPIEQFEDAVPIVADREPGREGDRSSPTTHNMKVQRQTPLPSSVGQATAGALGVPVMHQQLSVSGTIAAGQTLYSDAKATIHTKEDVRVTARVSNTRVSISFDPALTVTGNSGHWYVPNPDINISELYWDFTSQKAGMSSSAPRYAIWAGATTDILGNVVALINRLPPRMRAANYDPLNDENLASDLNSFITSMGSGSGSSMPRIADGEFEASVTLGGELRQEFGSASLTLPNGTQLTLTVAAQGDIPDKLEDLRIKTARISMSGGGSGASVNLKAFNTDLPLIFVKSATLSAGGSLAFDYTLSTEVVDSAFRLLIAAGAVAQGQGDRINGESLEARHERLRALVNAAVSKHVEPLLRKAILSNRNIIPGIDLGQALGLGSAAGDYVPLPAPAGPGSAYG
jgi:hypothetical protein